VNENSSDRMIRDLGSRLAVATERRGLLALGTALGGALLGGALLPGAAAKKKRKKKKKRPQDKPCEPGKCLEAPFTIEARWTNAALDHYAFLVVPNASGASLSMPYLDYACTSGKTGAGGLYPFAFVNPGPGSEVTTVASLLDGRYEYWISLHYPAPARELTVDLRNTGGQVIGSWISPANQDAARRGWHVFDFDGERRSFTSVNQALSNAAFGAAFFTSTRLCV
jgi:hypothetical protein